MKRHITRKPRQPASREIITAIVDFRIDDMREHAYSVMQGAGSKGCPYTEVDLIKALKREQGGPEDYLVTVAHYRLGVEVGRRMAGVR